MEASEFQNALKAVQDSVSEQEGGLEPKSGVRLKRHSKEDSVTMVCPKCGKVYISSADYDVDDEGYPICVSPSCKGGEEVGTKEGIVPDEKDSEEETVKKLEEQQYENEEDWFPPPEVDEKMRAAAKQLKTDKLLDKRGLGDTATDEEIADVLQRILFDASALPTNDRDRYALLDGPEKVDEANKIVDGVLTKLADEVRGSLAKLVITTKMNKKKVAQEIGEWFFSFLHYSDLKELEEPYAGLKESKRISGKVIEKEDYPSYAEAVEKVYRIVKASDAVHKAMAKQTVINWIVNGRIKHKDLSERHVIRDIVNFLEDASELSEKEAKRLQEQDEEEDFFEARRKRCPGSKIRSGGKGQGLGRGKGEGPIGKPRKIKGRTTKEGIVPDEKDSEEETIRKLEEQGQLPDYRIVSASTRDMDELVENLTEAIEGLFGAKVYELPSLADTDTRGFIVSKGSLTSEQIEQIDREEIPSGTGEGEIEEE